MSAKHSVAEKICLTCGLCCNGVIFADVQLQRGDDATRLEALGLALKNLPKQSGAKSSTDTKIAAPKKKFSQPCVAFDGCRCRIYAERPGYCRAFDCALLKSVNADEIKTAGALQTIERARRRAEKVRQLLRKVGDKDEHIALSLRFRRTAKRIQESKVDKSMAHLFSELTLAFQDLNLLLGEKFYPGATKD
jgi:Fe-S-cluster containining protein